jgi:hypothetical protein
MNRSGPGAPAGQSSDGRRKPDRPRGPYLLAFVFLLAVDCAFLSPALFTSDVRAPADITPHFPPFLADRPDPPKLRNALLQDWITQFHPWHHLVRDAYAQGRVPLWNDKAGCGEPLLANGQCEALSPFLPLLLLTKDQYADWRQLAQLAVSQAFCLLLAAHLGLSAWAGIVVALSYAFSSYMQIWAVHPHAASASFAPGILWALLRLSAAPAAARLLVAALLVALSLLAGHVETAAKAGVAAGAIAFLHALLRKPACGRLRFGLLIGGAGVFGLLLAACLLVPFFDYLGQSETREVRSRFVDQPLPLANLVTLLDPGALGSALEPPTYRGAGSWADAILHVGRAGLALACAGLVLGLVCRPRIVIPLTLVGAAGVAIACDVLRDVAPVSSFWRSVPGLGDIWPWRFLYFAILPLALLGGIGFDLIARMSKRFSVRTRRIVAAAVVLATAVTAALPWCGFLPAAPASALHPTSRALDRLASRATTGRTVEIGRILPPGLGESYGFRRLARYDAIGLRRLSDLFRVEDGFPIRNDDQLTFAPPALLDALSVRWVLSTYPAADARVPLKPMPVTPGAPASFEVAALPKFPGPLDLVLFRYGPHASRDGTIEVVVAHPGGETVWSLARQGWVSSAGPAASPPTPLSVVEFMQTQIAPFHPEPLSIPASVWSPASRVTFRAKDGAHPFWATALFPNGLGRDVVETDDLGWLRIAERRGAMPDASLAPLVRWAVDRHDAGRRVRAPGFDPHVETVVELGIGGGDLEGPPLEAGEHATIRRREPGLIEIDVRAATNRTLVVTEAFARGWRATVDGADVPVHPANLVVMSCPVPAGSHAVVMRYVPASFMAGCATSAVTLLWLLAAAVVGRKRRLDPGYS